MQVNNFFIDLALRLLATIQIGVIVQVCYTPRLQCVTCLGKLRRCVRPDIQKSSMSQLGIIERCMQNKSVF